MAAAGEIVLNEASDVTLLAHVCRHDEQALELLYDRYSRLSYAIALRMTRDQATAETIVETVFRTLWQSPRSVESAHHLQVWVISMARRSALQLMRTRTSPLNTDTVASGDVELMSSHGNLGGSTMSVAVTEALGSLPPEQRQVLELVYYDGFTSRAVAAHIGEPLGTIKTRLRLGLLKMCMLLRSPEI